MRRGGAFDSDFCYGTVPLSGSGAVPLDLERGYR